MKLQIQTDEYWWGLFADRGVEMPYSAKTELEIPVRACDQGAFVLVSNMGRYLYSETPHAVVFQNGCIICPDADEIELADGYCDLRGACRALAAKYFSADKKIPHEKFFAVPQYNTWIELMYDQNQKDILNYAEEIVKNGMEPGILMIDEGWANDYGCFDFSKERFEAPQAMVARLHELGFTVMLWVVPIISPDSGVFRELRETDILLRDRDGNIAIREWWNGYSAVLDLSNPKAVEWFCGKLDTCMEKYGVDGFKFDAGDEYFYRKDDRYFTPTCPYGMTEFYNRLGTRYAFNEFRAGWNVKGNPYVCRLQDKLHSWDTSGLAAIVPDMLAQGIIGCYFGCPDMIGGGSYGSFLGDFKADEELYIRWIEASALCPMMQFSIAPWRVLTAGNLKIVQRYVKLHESYGKELLQLARNAAEHGEPILRYMEYEFPHQGLAEVTDQFMLGSRILAAPVLKKGERTREVHLPAGRWRHGDKVYEGAGAVTVEAALEILPVFEKLED